MAHSCLHIAYCSAYAWAIITLVQIRYKAWRFNRFPNCPNLCTTQWSIYARIYRPYMGAAMGHARIHGPYGSSNGACMRAYMAIYGGIHGPHGSSNGACMGAYMGHMGQPYRESREEGNSRESLPFPGSPCPFPSAPFPVGREGSGGYSFPFPSLFRSVNTYLVILEESRY